MSISAAISNALSGLAAASRGTEVVSSNLANINTPGYAARELLLSPRTYIGNSGGVYIDGIARRVPTAILADSRIAQADLGKSGNIFEFHSRMETAIGLPNTPDSLTSLITEFEAALTHAEANPASDVRLESIFQAASSIADKLNYIALEVQNVRSEADKNIASDVARLNTALAEVAHLNRLVTASQSKGQDTASLLDARQKVIDQISDIVPVKEVPRAEGQIALFTKGGATLLDGTQPAVISFTATPIVTPHMSVEENHLGSLTFENMALNQRQMASLFSGGSLEANFQIRDDLASSYQQKIDTYALDLSSRLSGPNIDPTISSTDPSLFTDRQAAVVPTSIVGLANRLQVNNIVNPAAGGDIFRIRDGLGATLPADVGNGTLLTRIRNALSNGVDPSLTGIPTSGQSSFTLASTMASTASVHRISSENTFQHHTSYANSMTASLLSYGVDSDQEIANLLQLERIFSANAKIIQATSDMLDNILRL